MLFKSYWLVYQIGSYFNIAMVLLQISALTKQGHGLGYLWLER